MRPKKLNLHEEEQRVRMWNEKYPVGTRVSLRLDNGETLITHTRSEAWLLYHGQAVISVEGKSGGWALDRVSPIREDETEPVRKACL